MSGFVSHTDHPYQTTILLWGFIVEQAIAPWFWSVGGTEHMIKKGVVVEDDVIRMRDYPVRIVAKPYGGIPYDEELINRLYSPDIDRTRLLTNDEAHLLFEFSRTIFGGMYLVMKQIVASSGDTFPYLSAEPLFDLEEDAILYQMACAEERCGLHSTS